MRNGISVFLDRDGTINREISYNSNPSNCHLLPGAAKAIKKLNMNKIPVIVITNQAGVARGYYDEYDILRFNVSLFSKLLKYDAYIDAIYYCPFYKHATRPEYKKDCLSRKPKPGMIHCASNDFSIDITNSFMVGDMETDMTLGKRLKMKSILVLTGLTKTADQVKYWEVKPDYIAEDLLEAVNYIFK